MSSTIRFISHMYIYLCSTPRSEVLLVNESCVATQAMPRSFAAVWYLCLNTRSEAPFMEPELHSGLLIAKIHHSNQ